jgi:hypothetical protein
MAPRRLGAIPRVEPGDARYCDVESFFIASLDIESFFIASCDIASFDIESFFFIASCDIASFDMESFFIASCDIASFDIESFDIAPVVWAKAIEPVNANVTAVTAVTKNFISTSIV